MKSISLVCFLIGCTLFTPARAESANAAGDSIKVVDKSFFGTKLHPGSRRPESITVKVKLEAVLKSLEAGTVRVAATVKSEGELTTLFIRSIRRGNTNLETPLSITGFKGKNLIIVVWIDPNPDEKISPPNPLVYEKFGFDLSNI